MVSHVVSLGAQTIQVEGDRVVFNLLELVASLHVHWQQLHVSRVTLGQLLEQHPAERGTGDTSVEQG